MAEHIRLKPCALFTDGCVLPRGQEIRVFGEAGAPVKGRLLAAGGALLAEAEADAAAGRFVLHFPPLAAQTGCTLLLTDGETEFAAADVAVGEVYLAGGQSNMELALCNADEGPETARTVDDPLMRYFNVPKHARPGEDADRDFDTARWQRFTAGQGMDMSAVACFFALKLRAHLDVPVGIIDCWWGGTSITCWLDEEALLATAEGQRYAREYAEASRGVDMETYLRREKVFMDAMDAWNRRVAEVKRDRPDIPWEELIAIAGDCPWDPPFGPGSPYRPAGLAETMLRRIVPASLTGILYYQGEEDAGKTAHYETLMTALIHRWRELFRNPELPFLFVQLPMWIARGAEDSKLWPRLRHAQELAWRETRGTGLAILIDEGEFDNIHPTNKRVVGERLFEQARSVVYGEAGAESPRALRKESRGGVLTVALSAPVTARGEADLFEVAGADGGWQPAACRVEGCTLRLSSPAVPRPVSARYAWCDWARVHLFGENGLPLAPFVLEG